MQLSPEMVNDVLDQNMLQRSLIMVEVTKRKCEMYYDMADTDKVKKFFRGQVDALEDSQKMLKVLQSQL